MNGPSRRGPVVIDTDVYGAALVPGSTLAAMYHPILVGRPAFISLQTAAELRYGALLRSWGRARMLKLAARIAAAEVVHSGPDLIATYAQLRVDANVPATPWLNASTTPTAGSPPPPSGSASPLFPTTGSSRAHQASLSNQRTGSPDTNATVGRRRRRRRRAQCCSTTGNLHDVQLGRKRDKSAADALGIVTASN